MAKRAGHGWWPYWAPLFSLLILIEIAGRTPETWQALFLPLKVLVPGGLFAWFYSRGSYAELRGWRPSGRERLLDTAVGVLGGAVWMAPYLIALRFDPPLWTVLPEFFQPTPEDAFDAAQLGQGLVGVALGAFGAHALKTRLSAELLVIFETGVRYQMFHALALIACGALSQRGVPTRMASRLFTAGIVLFSGSLYGLVLLEAKWLGPVTPIGGVLFLAGWAALAIASRKRT